MPIEIRELIIKTEILASEKGIRQTMGDKDLEAMREKLLDECRRIIASAMRRDKYKR